MSSELKYAYNVSMATYVIKNRVPSAEEMGHKLGLSAARINSVRYIMSSPSTTKTSKHFVASSPTTARTSKRYVSSSPSTARTSKRSSGKLRVGTSGKKLNTKQSTSRASGKR
jgi:hypothetical protein